MGTEYTLFRDEKRRTELSCYEMSSRFGLSADVCDESGYYLAEVTVGEQLTADELAGIALKLIECASWNGLSPQMLCELKSKIVEIRTDTLRGGA